MSCVSQHPRHFALICQTFGADLGAPEGNCPLPFSSCAVMVDVETLSTVCWLISAVAIHVEYSGELSMRASFRMFVLLAIVLMLVALPSVVMAAGGQSLSATV